MTHEPLDLDAIKARCEAAIPGPWGWIYYDGYRGLVTAEDRKPVMWAEHDEHEAWIKCSQGSADLIEHAADDIPALIAEIERLRAEVTTKLTPDQQEDEDEDEDG